MCQSAAMTNNHCNISSLDLCIVYLYLMKYFRRTVLIQCTNGVCLYIGYSIINIYINVERTNESINITIRFSKLQPYYSLRLPSGSPQDHSDRTVCT